MYTVRPARHSESECFLRVSGQQFSVVCLNIVKSALEMRASAFGSLTQRLQGAQGRTCPCFISAGQKGPNKSFIHSLAYRH